MRGWLLDTNLLSEVVRRSPDPGVMERLRKEPAASLYTSAVCVMELRYGAVRLPAGAALWRRIEGEVLAKVQILGAQREVAERAGELLAELEKRGTPIGTEDVLIAATALVHDLGVSTRNTRHFSRIVGLHVESWWSA